jgi:anti-sigma regulatory factor (Ser/Thr protein kinase)
MRGDTDLYEAEYRSVRPSDGAILWYASTGSVVRDPATGKALKVIGVIRAVTELYEARAAREAERVAAAARQRAFMKEMLFGLTEGRFRLLDDPSGLPAELPPACDPVSLSDRALGKIRQQVMETASEVGMPQARAQDLETATQEAAANAVRHAGEGEARVHADRATGTLQVWVRDMGKGITDHLIHRAVESGWTTGGFGQGFHLMWLTCDRLYLLTGTSGTTVVLEQERTTPPPSWLLDERRSSVPAAVMNGVSQR